MIVSDFRSHGEATVGRRPPAYVVIFRWSSAGSTSTWIPSWRCDGTAGTNVPHKRQGARYPSPRCSGLLQRIRVDHSSNPIQSNPIQSNILFALIPPRRPSRGARPSGRPNPPGLFGRRDKYYLCITLFDGTSRTLSEWKQKRFEFRSYMHGLTQHARLKNKGRCRSL